MAEISYKIKKNGAEIEKALERAEKLTGIAGTVVFDDTEEQLLLDSHGWFTNAPGLYSVSGDGFNGVLLIAESGVTEGGQGNVTVSKEPSFVLIGNAAPVSFSPDDPDVFENITSGDPFLPMLFFRRAELSMTVYSPSRNFLHCSV